MNLPLGTKVKFTRDKTKGYWSTQSAAWWSWDMYRKGDTGEVVGYGDGAYYIWPEGWLRSVRVYAFEVEPL